MNTLVKLGLQIASLPIFTVKDNLGFIRLAQDALAKNKVEQIYKEQGDYYLIDHYLLSDLTDSKVPIRIFSPKQDRRPGILLFFHGGGFATGNLDIYTESCLELAEATNRVVFAVDYRLAPEYPYPAALEDCYSVAYELTEHFSQGDHQQEVFIIGDSAGANLATVVARNLAKEKNHQIAGEILIYPTMGYNYSEEFAKKNVFPSLEDKGYEYGLTLQKMRDYYSLYLTEEKLNLMGKDPNVTPLVSDQLNVLPKTLIITAEHDPLKDEGKLYSQKLKESGVKTKYQEIKGVPHGFFTRSRLFPEAQSELFDLINQCLDEDF